VVGSGAPAIGSRAPPIGSPLGPVGSRMNIASTRCRHWIELVGPPVRSVAVYALRCWRSRSVGWSVSASWSTSGRRNMWSLPRLGGVGSVDRVVGPGGQCMAPPRLDKRFRAESVSLPRTGLVVSPSGTPGRSGSASTACSNRRFQGLFRQQNGSSGSSFVTSGGVWHSLVGRMSVVLRPLDETGSRFGGYGRAMSLDLVDAASEPRLRATVETVATSSGRVAS
jgi:hypothetical protein